MKEKHFSHSSFFSAFPAGTCFWGFSGLLVLRVGVFLLFFVSGYISA